MLNLRLNLTQKYEKQKQKKKIDQARYYNLEIQRCLECSEESVFHNGEFCNKD